MPTAKSLRTKKRLVGEAKDISCLLDEGIEMYLFQKNVHHLSKWQQWLGEFGEEESSGVGKRLCSNFLCEAIFQPHYPTWKFFSLNYYGLGNSQAVRDIHCFVKELDPHIMFLIETKPVYSKSWTYEVEAGHEVYFGCLLNDLG